MEWRFCADIKYNRNNTQSVADTKTLEKQTIKKTSTYVCTDTLSFNISYMHGTQFDYCDGCDLKYRASLQAYSAKKSKDYIFLHEENHKVFKLAPIL